MGYLEICEKQNSLSKEVEDIQNEVYDLAKSLAKDFFFIEDEDYDDEELEDLIVLWFDKDGIEVEIGYNSYLITTDFVVDSEYRERKVEEHKEYLKQQAELYEFQKASRLTEKAKKEYELYLQLKEKYEH